MAGISTSIELMDRISAPLNRIQATLYSATQAFGKVDEASNRCFDKFQIEAVSQELMRYENHIAETERQLKKANEQIERMQNETRKAKDEAGNLSGAFSTITSFIGGLGIAYIVKQQVSQAIDYASNLTEVQNVVDVSFGASAQKVNEWSKTTLQAYGINELTAKQYAGTMGAMLKSSGLAGESVTDMSMKMAELAGDMASFYNLRTEDAFYKIRAGISGETEPLKALGINMNICNLEAYALSQGITTAYKDMSQAEQVQLRYNYLMQAGADSIGDFSRTQGSLANQQRLLTENIREFTGELATNLLPLVTGATMLANKAVLFIKENWSTIQPLVIGLTVAVGLYTTALIVHKTMAILSALAEAKRGSAMMYASGATFKATVAQYGFNGAILACPLTWFILKIIAVIAVIFMIAQAVANASNGVKTGFGVICGVVAMAGALIYNIVIGVLNALMQLFWTIFVYPFLNIIEFILNCANGGFNSFGDAVANLIGNIIGWFLSLGTVVTKIIDAIFGTNWTAGLNDLKDKVTAWGKNEKAIELDRTYNGIQRIEYGNAYDAGTAWGDGIADKIGGMFKNPTDNGMTQDANAMNAIAGNTANTAKNTDKLSQSVDISNEQLQYMRDLAEQETINRYTTAEIKVDMTNNNNISSNMDIQDVISQLSDGVNEAMKVSAEGVH